MNNAEDDWIEIPVGGNIKSSLELSDGEGLTVRFAKNHRLNVQLVKGEIYYIGKKGGDKKPYRLNRIEDGSRNPYLTLTDNEDVLLFFGGKKDGAFSKHGRAKIPEELSWKDLPTIF